MKGASIVDFIKGRTPGAPKATRYLDSHGTEVIRQLHVCRSPIVEGIDKVLNAVSFGQYGKAKQDLQIDKMFHLYLVITTDKTQIRLEKNEVITAYDLPTHIPKGYNVECRVVPLKQTQLTVSQLYKNTLAKYGEENFFTYSGFNWNCQNFVSIILSANGLMNASLLSFVSQPVQALAKRIPFYVPYLSNKVTNLAARFRTIIGEGIGFDRSFLKRSGEGLSRQNIRMKPEKKLWIQNAIRHPGKFRALATKAHALDRTGKIKKGFIAMEAHSTNPTIRKEAVLARTLAGLRRHKKKRHESAFTKSAQNGVHRIALNPMNHIGGSISSEYIDNVPPAGFRSTSNSWKPFDGWENNGLHKKSEERHPRHQFKLTRVPTALM